MSTQAQTISPEHVHALRELGFYEGDVSPITPQGEAMNTVRCFRRALQDLNLPIRMVKYYYHKENGRKFIQVRIGTTSYSLSFAGVPSVCGYVHAFNLYGSACPDVDKFLKFFLYLMELDGFGVVQYVNRNDQPGRTKALTNAGFKQVAAYRNPRTGNLLLNLDKELGKSKYRGIDNFTLQQIPQTSISGKSREREFMVVLPDGAVFIEDFRHGD